jgi:topoisomerase-4 subunit A
VRALKGHEVDVAAQTFKAGDGLWGAFRCRSVDPLIVVGSSGRVYSVPVSTLPGGRGDGQPITTMIELESGTQIAHYVAAAPTQRLVFAGSTGYGFVAQVGDLVGRQKAGKTFLALDQGETPLLAPVPGDAVALQLGVLSAQGRLLSFPLDELKHQPKGGKGLMLMDLEAKDSVVSVACFTTQLRVLGSGRGGKPRDEVLKNQSLAAHAGKRARKGKAVEGLQKVARLATD